MNNELIQNEFFDAIIPLIYSTGTDPYTNEWWLTWVAPPETLIVKENQYVNVVSLTYQDNGSTLVKAYFKSNELGQLIHDKKFGSYKISFNY